MPLSGDVAAAYSATGAAWGRGPGRVYDRLAERLVDACPVPLAGGITLDLGAGTGAASRAAAGRGARVVAVDAALGMLLAGAGTRPPSAAADALALPFPEGTFDAVIAAFSLNHLHDPAAGLAEAARVTRTGGAVVAGSYALDDSHPARDAVDAAARALGWRPPPWYRSVREETVPLLATVDRAAAAARGAGLVDVRAANVRVGYPDLGPADLVAWRLGMAHLAPFVASLPAVAADGLLADALARLEGAPRLERSVIVLTGRVRREPRRAARHRGRRSHGAPR